MSDPEVEIMLERQPYPLVVYGDCAHPRRHSLIQELAHFLKSSNLGGAYFVVLGH
jgi:hypothetical protein